MRTNTFNTARQTRQQNNQGTRYPRATLTLLGVSVLTFGLVSALVVIPASAKSGRGSSGSSSSQHRDDDTLSGRLSHDDRHDDDDDNDRNRHGRHDNRHDDDDRHDDDRNRDHDDRDDDRNKNRNNNTDDRNRNRNNNARHDNNNKKQIDGQVTHVDNMRFTVRTADGKTRAFKHASFDHANDSHRPQENDHVRVDFKDNSGKQPFRVTRTN